MNQTISELTWTKLTNENKIAHALGWAKLGVFATGVGEEYRPFDENSILYVGKSAGPLGSQIGASATFLEASEASTAWMQERRNRSAFWQMIEKVDKSRRTIAWTNICKFDRLDARIPPRGSEWARVREVCMAALTEEIESLRPRTILFATSDFAKPDVHWALSRLGYDEALPAIDDGWTSALVRKDGARAVLTRHPQGWPAENRDAFVKWLRERIAAWA